MRYVYIIICCKRERDGRTETWRPTFSSLINDQSHRVFERVWRVCVLRAAKKKRKKEGKILSFYSCRPGDGDLWSPALTGPMIYYYAAHTNTHTHHTTLHIIQHENGVASACPTTLIVYTVYTVHITRVLCRRPSRTIPRDVRKKYC